MNPIHATPTDQASTGHDLYRGRQAGAKARRVLGGAVGELVAREIEQADSLAFLCDGARWKALVDDAGGFSGAFSAETRRRPSTRREGRRSDVPTRRS